MEVMKGSGGGMRPRKRGMMRRRGCFEWWMKDSEGEEVEEEDAIKD